jgi:hypothetical protein
MCMTETPFSGKWLSGRASVSVPAPMKPQAVCLQLTAAERAALIRRRCLQRRNNQQGSYMSHAYTDDVPGSIAPVLSATLLTRTQQLNLDYLDLLTSQRPVPLDAVPLQCLPAELTQAIAALSHTSRALLAAVPYTLYSLGFEDAAFWRGACRAIAIAEVPIAQRYASGEPGAHRPFCEVALLHAWHVAISNRLAARVVYAMPDAVATCIAGTPLWRLRSIADDHAALLSPRWPTNPGFWPDLVRFAAARDVTRLTTAKLLGSQLIAAELDLAEGRNTHVAGSPRLRARRMQLRARMR